MHSLYLSHLRGEDQRSEEAELTLTAKIKEALFGKRKKPSV